MSCINLAVSLAGHVESIVMILMRRKSSWIPLWLLTTFLDELLLCTWIMRGFSRLLAHPQISLNLLVLNGLCLSLSKIFDCSNFVLLIPVALVCDWDRIHHRCLTIVVAHYVLRTVSGGCLAACICRVTSLKLILALTLILPLHIKLLKLLSLFRSRLSCMLEKLSRQISHSRGLVSTFIDICAPYRLIIIKLRRLHDGHLGLLHLSV